MPDGQAVELHAYRAGGGVPTPVAVGGTDTSAGDITMPGGGFIHVVARTIESTGATPTPAPVRVQVLVAGDAPRPGTTDVGFASFGERGLVRGDRVHVEFPLDGDVTVPVEAGTYRVVVSRGVEYEIYDEAAVVVGAGATVDVNADLARSVDSTDVLCGDFHIHTTRSPDSPDHGLDKIHYALADGVELPLRTDHEFVRDFEPEIQELGAGSWAFGMPGLEYTTFDYGHFGVFPLPPDDSAINGGAPQWRDLDDEDAETGLARLRLAPEVFAELADRPSAPELIIFHPRGANIASYFSASGYDNATGIASDTALWDEDAFSIVEAFNDTSFGENYDTDATADSTVRDWFSFLSRGKRVTVVGSSDSHSVLGGSPVGYPRTCVRMGTDNPDDLRGTMDAADVRDTVRGGAVVINGGVFLTATADTGEEPGDTVTGATDTENIRVTVQAPTWIQVTTLEVWVNGELAFTDTVPDTGVALRYDADVPVTLPTGNSFVVFHARGDVDGTGMETATLAPVFPGRVPFGVTNALYFER